MIGIEPLKPLVPGKVLSWCSFGLAAFLLALHLGNPLPVLVIVGLSYVPYTGRWLRQ